MVFHIILIDNKGPWFMIPGSWFMAQDPWPGLFFVILRIRVFESLDNQKKSKIDDS